MEKTIVLLDGKHTVRTPSFYALSLMVDGGVSFDDNDFTFKDISNIVAAMLTDAEPLNDQGYPEKMWTPPMAAKLMTPAMIEPVMNAVTELLVDAFPDSKPEDDSKTRPTKARTSSGKA